MFKKKLENYTVTGEWIESEGHSRYYEVKLHLDNVPFATDAYGSQLPKYIGFSICEGMICSLRIIQRIKYSSYKYIDDLTDQNFKDLFYYGLCAYYYDNTYVSKKHYYGEKLKQAYLSTQLVPELTAFLKQFFTANGFKKRGKYVNTDDGFNRNIYVLDGDEDMVNDIRNTVEQWRKEK